MFPKYILRLTFSLILTCSILAPTFAVFVDSSHEKLAVMDLGDEEKGKETEKKFGENELFFEIDHSRGDDNLLSSSNVKSPYLLKHQQIHFEIVLPPPEVLSTHIS